MKLRPDRGEAACQSSRTPSLEARSSKTSNFQACGGVCCFFSSLSYRLTAYSTDDGVIGMIDDVDDGNPILKDCQGGGEV